VIWQVEIVTPQGQAKCRYCQKQDLFRVECVLLRDGDHYKYMHKDCFQKLLVEEKEKIEKLMTLNLDQKGKIW